MDYDNAYRSDARRRRKTLDEFNPREPAPGEREGRWKAALYGAVDPLGITSGAIGQVFPDARYAMRTAQEEYPDAAGTGGLLSPLSAVPFIAGGKAVNAAVSAARARPAATGGLLGGLAFASPSAIGDETDDGLTSAQRDELKSLRDKMSKGAFKSAADRRSTERRVSELDGLQTEFSKRRNEARQGQDAEKVMEADAARRDILNKADKPFAQQFPGWNAVQPYLPLAVGALTTAPFLGRAAVAQQAGVNRWRDSAEKGLKATSADELAAASRLTNAYRDQYGKTAGPFAGYGAPMAVGGVEGAIVANLPEAYNAMLPAENPERRAYSEYIKRLPQGHPEIARAREILGSLPQVQPERTAAFNHFGSTDFLKRMGVGAFEGAGGGAFSKTLSKGIAPPAASYPIAQTEALQGRMSAAGVSDATKAIRAETEAMRSVLPKPAERPQMPAGLLDDLPPPMPVLPSVPVQPSNVVTANPPRPSRFGDDMYGGSRKHSDELERVIEENRKRVEQLTRMR